MIRIGRMSISLPHGLQHRADSIAREVRRSLAGGREMEGANVRHLTGVEVRCSVHRQDGVIGRAIADAIHSRLTSPRGGRDG